MDAKKKILLVDGDQNFGHTVAKALNTKKYSFFYAQSGTVGIQMALDHHPDLILYNLALDPIDGCDVFRAFKTAFSEGLGEVVFLRDNAVNEANAPCNELDEKAVMVKTDNTDQVIKFIESCIWQSRNTKNDKTHDFDTLFHLSPYGVFIIAGERVLKANSFLWEMIGRDKESVNLKLEDLFERSSFLKVRHWIKHYSKDTHSVFNESVIVKDIIGGEYPVHLKLSEFKAANESVQLIGFVSPSTIEKNGIVNYHLASEVCNMLKRENLPITQSLEKKITQIIKLRTVDNKDQSKEFFTKRENEVLLLTMEGLSIKVIADKLSISSRTVEKYRTKLMEKSGARNIVEVIVFCLKNNLIKI